MPFRHDLILTVLVALFDLTVSSFHLCNFVVLALAEFRSTWRARTVDIARSNVVAQTDARIVSARNA